jgi:cytoskeletal protein RodZ
MNKLYNTFESQLREKMAGHEMPYNPQDWNALQASMRPKGRSSSAVIVALLATLAVVGTAGIIWDQTINQKSSAKIASNAELGTSTPSLSNSNNAATESIDSKSNTSNNQNFASNGSINTNDTSNLFVGSRNPDNFQSGNTTQALDNSVTEDNSPANNGNADNQYLVSSSKSGENVTIKLSTRKACAGTEIEFQVESLPPGVKGNYIWNFGDGKFKAEKTPTNTYSKAGEYDISLSITDDNGRINTQVFNKAIIIVPEPRPLFGWHFVNEDPAHPMIQIHNTSANANSAEWKLSNGSVSNDINPSFKLDGNGKHLIGLQVANDYGCTRGSVKQVVVNSELDLKAPTQLKSNNLSFMPELLKSNKYNFVMSIYDANGNKVYETSNRNKGWDGSLPGGANAQSGQIYQWKVIVVNDLTKEEKYFNGTLNIIP